MKKSTFFTLFVIIVFLFSVRIVNANEWLLEGTTDLRDYQGPVTDQWDDGYNG